MYVFSSDVEVTRQAIAQTSSGGVGVNATLYHIVCPEIEFGGGTARWRAAHDRAPAAA